MRVAVVTGGSSGIGASTARLLTRRGWRCVLVARGAERLRRVAGEIGAEWEVCDVGDRAAVAELGRRLAERHAAVHLLVANAGVSGRKGYLELGPERIEEVMRTNYLGGVWCLLALLPLLEADPPTDLVNVVSAAGTVSHGASGPYTAAKHAQLAFSRSTTAELAGRGIRVHTVNPGPVETPGFPQDRLRRRALARHLVLSPEDVARAIVAAVEKNRAEVVIPRYLRFAGAAQALAPATFTRLVTRARRRR